MPPSSAKFDRNDTTAVGELPEPEPPKSEDEALERFGTELGKIFVSINKQAGPLAPGSIRAPRGAVVASVSASVMKAAYHFVVFIPEGNTVFRNRAPQSFVYTRGEGRVVEHSLLRLLVRVLRALSFSPDATPTLPSNIVLYFSDLRRTANSSTDQLAKDLHRVKELIGILAVVSFAAYVFSPHHLSQRILEIARNSLLKDDFFFSILQDSWDENSAWRMNHRPRVAPWTTTLEPSDDEILLTMTDQTWVMSLSITSIFDYHSVKAENTDQREEIKSLSNKLSQLRESLDNATETTSSQERIVDSLQREVNVSEADIAALSQDLAKVGQEVEDQRGYKKELDTLRNAAASYDKDRERLEKEIEQLQAALATEREKVISERQASVLREKSLLEEHQVKNHNSHIQLQKTQTVVDELTKKVTILLKERGDRDRLREKFNSELEAISSKTAEIVRQRDSHQAAHAEARSLLKVREDENEELRRELQQLSVSSSYESPMTQDSDSKLWCQSLEAVATEPSRLITTDVLGANSKMKTKNGLAENPSGMLVLNTIATLSPIGKMTSIHERLTQQNPVSASTGSASDSNSNLISIHESAVRDAEVDRLIEMCQKLLEERAFFERQRVIYKSMIEEQRLFFVDRLEKESGFYQSRLNAFQNELELHKEAITHLRSQTAALRDGTRHLMEEVEELVQRQEDRSM